MKNQGVYVWDEITISIKGRKPNGRTGRIKYTHQISSHSLMMHQSRPFKNDKKNKFIPSEYVFHNITFATQSDLRKESRNARKNPQRK